jgi:class 3 adenylate cyclase
MAASGLPKPRERHTNSIIHAALDIRDYIEEAKTKNIHEGHPFFELRIGLNTGPIVAGIVGVKKFQYDIWGDTVNTASRMETSGVPGKVNISQATYDILKDDPELVFEDRGKIKTKGKGEMQMYFVD